MNFLWVFSGSFTLFAHKAISLQNGGFPFHLAHFAQKLEVFPRSIWVNEEVSQTMILPLKTWNFPILPLHIIGSRELNNLSSILEPCLLVFESCHYLKDFYLNIPSHIAIVIFDDCDLQVVQQWSINIESKVFTIMGAHNTIKELYKINKESEIVINNKIGTYDPISGFELDEPSIWVRRSNLQGHKFRIGYHLNKLAIIETKPDGSYGGILGQILGQLQESLNFTTEMIVEPTGHYGSLIDENHFDAMVGMIQNGEVDIGLAHLSITQERLEAIDILEPLWSSTFELLAKRPKVSIQWTTYVRGYNITFWTTYILMVLLLMIISVCMARYWSLPQSLILGHLFGSILNRDITTIDSQNLKLNMRILLFSSMCFSFVVFATYTAVLTSFLAKRDLTVPVKSLEDFLKPEHKLALKKGTVVYDMFRFAKKGTIFNKLYEQKVKPDQRAVYEANLFSPMNEESNLNRQMDMGYYLVLDTKYYSLVVGKPCQAMITPINKFIIDFSSFGISKDAPYKHLFNFHLRRQRDSGVWKTFIRRVFDAEPNLTSMNKCEPDEDEDSRIGLNIETTFSAFFMFACGILISLGILLAERVHVWGPFVVAY